MKSIWDHQLFQWQVYLLRFGRALLCHKPSLSIVRPDFIRLLFELFSRTGNETRPINQTATYVSTWTYDTCLPVFDITFEPYGSTDFRYFYDISVGIKDPEVFIPPPQCFSIDNRREKLSDFE